MKAPSRMQNGFKADGWERDTEKEVEKRSGIKLKLKYDVY